MVENAYESQQGSIELVGPHIGHKIQLNLDRFNDSDGFRLGN